MIVDDEYLAVRSLLGVLPEGLPNEPLAITTSVHWRLLQRVHAPAGGQLSQALAALPASDREALRFPHREVLDVLDPRPRLDEAAQTAALGVSRPTVVRLIEAGKLPARMVGSHRRRMLSDVLAHREASARRRGEALDDMARQAEDLALSE